MGGCTSFIRSLAKDTRKVGRRKKHQLREYKPRRKAMDSRALIPILEEESEELLTARETLNRLSRAPVNCKTESTVNEEDPWSPTGITDFVGCDRLFPSYNKHRNHASGDSAFISVQQQQYIKEKSETAWQDEIQHRAKTSSSFHALIKIND